jgi:hypothetical protein
VFVRCGQVPQVVVDLMFATALKGREIRYGAGNGGESSSPMSELEMSAITVCHSDTK